MRRLTIPGDPRDWHGAPRRRLAPQLHGSERSSARRSSPAGFGDPRAAECSARRRGGGHRNRALDGEARGRGQRQVVHVAQAADEPVGYQHASRHDPVRARLVGVGHARVRPAHSRQARGLDDGLVRAPGLRHLVCRLRRLRSLRQVAARERRCRVRRRRPRRGVGIHHGAKRRPAASDVRCILRRVACRAVRPAPAAARAATRARRAGVDRRRQPDAGRAQEAARAVPGEQPAADRSCVRAKHLHARSSRDERSDGGRRVPSLPSTHRCRTGRTSTCPPSCPCSIRRRSRCRR